MKKIFYIGLAGFIAFEVLKVYFIMPMPGSQNMESVELAYFLHSWRWFFRCLFLVFLGVGAYHAFQSQKWIALSSLALAAVVAGLFNFKLSADVMFYQPEHLSMQDAASNAIAMDKLVLGVQHQGEARAYPIQLIAYHHQVLDTLADKPIMVTYCSVCRTGRVFEPLINGRPETFRLVGMDHFNAMFEDQNTRSWWRQANGQAIAGKLKGQTLPELLTEQTTLEKWLALYPNSLVMQADSTFAESYASLEDYDFGIERGALTRTDTLSWKDKSWVVGIVVGNESKAFDWNQLKEKRIFNESLGNTPIILVLASDQQSFFAFERPSKEVVFSMENDTLIYKDQKYDLRGLPLTEEGTSLKKINAYQEFWHSWRTFHPNTQR
ncbi:DUF3179 domain-containing (seleno)protein [Catalinimonas niigatensis]|uniref:DUF3179 domain-containing (seleno)protein n=1 Tax=Catalinimonas niigatensis TaxID=1397264 RepID=UPI0026659888|nr:DUF3179 domain-containing (seleno)protein [Catalinimonas niigatensis]WPP52783.1 DUF3179 domain-containing (seleno)protein [Catalinimonas niigatensis]